ncbi:MAG TPA: cupin domain-containing protein [Pseudomonadales bacterium]|nr:cupin domain-containing protein [Pseudomonadales bacterium]
MHVVSPKDIANALTELWSPRVVAELDDSYVKVAKLHGTLAWHSHDDEDELFYVLSGRLRIEMEQTTVELAAGDAFVVPKGVRHNPVAEQECLVMLIERKTTRHTGSEVTAKTRSIAEQLRPIASVGSFFRDQAMSNSEQSTFFPPGWPRMATRIFADDHEELVRFLVDVFGATGALQRNRPSEIRIGDAVLLVSGIAERAAHGAILYVYVPDADATYRRALAAGARSLEAPAVMPYGDRRAMVEDRWGNTWQIATFRG